MRPRAIQPEAHRANGHTAEVPPAPAAAHVIHPSAVYSVAAARQALGLKSTTVRREVREGRLRVSKRAGRYFILGAWLLQWLEAGELRRRKGPAAGEGP